MSNNPTLRWFSYEHLPPALQPTSKIFAEMAATMLLLCPTASAELTLAFRDLLRAKDNFVRASILHAESEVKHAS